MTSPATSGTSLPVEAEAHERGSTLALLGWAGFAVLVLYTVLLGGGWIGIYSAGIRVTSLVIVSVGLAAWLIVAWRRPAWRPSTAIWPAFVLPLVAFGISTIASPFPRLGLDYVAWAVLLTALYLLLVRILAMPYARARIGGLAAMLALILGGAYIAMASSLWVEWWTLVGDLRVPPLRPMYLSMPWGGPSAVMTVQVLLCAVAVAGVGLATRASRALGAAVLVVTAAVTIISGSRSGWLAVAAALAIVAGLWLLTAADRAALLRVLRGSRAMMAAVLLGIGVVVVAIAVGPVVLERFLEGGDGGRPVYWATALRMFAESPVLGQGPGNWAARRMAYTEAGELDFYIPHAHDQVLETAAEFGLVGLAAGVIALGCVVWLSMGALRSTDPVRRRWAWATVFSVLYLGIATLVDSYTYPAILLPLAIPIAYLDATSDHSIGWPRRLQAAAGASGRLAIILLAVGCVAAIAFLARSEAVALTHARAVTAANEADWRGALEPALEAAEADQELAPYQVTAGLAAAGSGDWATAEAAFHAASALDDLPASWLGLAAAQAELGRPAAEVEASLLRAMRLGEQQAAISFVVGQVYERLGMTAAADSAYAAAMAAMPELAADARWADSLAPPDRFDEIAEQAMRSAPDAAWQIALMAGDVERARSLISQRPDEALLRSVIDGWEGDPGAIGAVQELADRDPMDATVLAWAARLSDRAGDADAAHRYRRLVDIGVRGASQGFEVRVADRVPARDAALGTSTYYYGNYLYRRTTPVDLIVPGMPGLIIDEDT